MTKGKIWINVKDDYDITIITDGLEKNGFTYRRRYVENTDEAGIVAACEGCVGVIAGMEEWNVRTLGAVKNHIRMIIRYGSGYNNVDVPAATACGIAVFNAFGRNAAAVAEVALMHMLNAGRKFSIGLEMAKRGECGLSDLTCFELGGKTVGLYGAGMIARCLARLLQGFNVKILAYDIEENEEIKQLGAEFVASPAELFSRSDIVSVHIPITPATEGIVNKELLSLMKPSAILVNTSRGGVINEADLLEALKAHTLRAACLDVLTHEPIRADDPLVLQENAYVTAHIGATSFEAKQRVEACLYTTIAEFFAGAYRDNIPNNYLNPPAR